MKRFKSFVTYLPCRSSSCELPGANALNSRALHSRAFTLCPTCRRFGSGEKSSNSKLFARCEDDTNRQSGERDLRDFAGHLM